MAHGDICAERLSFAFHERLVGGVVLQRRAHPALDERQVLRAVVIVVERTPSLFGYMTLTFILESSCRWAIEQPYSWA
jgi:hypothetical protein